MELLHTKGHPSNPWKKCPSIGFTTTGEQIPIEIHYHSFKKWYFIKYWTVSTYISGKFHLCKRKCLSLISCPDWSKIVPKTESVTPKVPWLCSPCLFTFGRGLLLHLNISQFFFFFFQWPEIQMMQSWLTFRYSKNAVHDVYKHGEQSHGTFQCLQSPDGSNNS